MDTFNSTTVMQQIEQEMDTRLPYRVGWPTLPVLPVVEEWDEDGTIFDKWTLAKIRRILLHEHIIKRFHLEPSYRFNRGQEKRPTLKISAVYDPALGNNTWIEAVKSIRQYLLSKGNDATIEIIDIAANYGHGRKPIDDDETGKKFREFLPTLHSLLVHHSWVALDLVDMSPKEADPSRPTIIISALDANSESWWSDTLPLIRNRAPAGLDIELRLGDEDMLASAHSDPRISIPAIAPMGACCGASGSQETGALGGLVVLGNEDLNLGLTCHHVLCKDSPGAQCIAPDHKLSTIVVAPSDKSIQDYTEDLDKSARCYESLKMQRHYRYTKSSKWVRIDERKVENRTRLEKKTISAIDRRLGGIFASSGFRSAMYDEDTGGLEDKDGNKLQWALDWCLVAPRPERGVSRVVTDVREYFGLKLSKNARPQEYRSLNGATTLSVVRKSPSGWARGRISKTPSVLNPVFFKKAHNPEAHEPDMHAVDNLDDCNRPVLAYGIVTGSSSEMFLNRGDSGTMVLLDESGDTAVIAGLGFASNSASGVAYMTPMRVVIQDIENVTGKTVSVPQYGGQFTDDFNDTTL
ncbi:hypothetical protein N0V90_005051 [Kalmusia sp. IMI 367209]|nr:hypothetical protein N0V90_005051 [Kalmusia sp. IMI 367209]